MTNTEIVIDVIVQQGILPLYFHKEAAISIEVLRAVYKAGVKAIEYTNRGREALENFAAMVSVRNTEMPDLLLGAGTVKNLQTANAYMKAGADFLVSPGFVKEIADYAIKENIFYAPGCMTPTEIIAAENAGVKFIKLFPGNMLKPEFINSIKDVFPNLLFMPTGGVDTTKENIAEWFAAGVCAVGMGSKLISKQLIEVKDYNLVEDETRRVLTLIKSEKNKN